MRLIVARHGNTFSDHDRVIWLGGSDDPPLTREGEHQAKMFASTLLSAGVQPAAVYASPLRRTVRYASIVLDLLGLPQCPIIDERLGEIDYGMWRGLSNEEIRSAFGDADWENWYFRSVWPASASWISREEEFYAAVETFLSDLRAAHEASQIAIAVTTHGVLKCLGRILARSVVVPAALSLHRVDTGRICDLTLSDETMRLNSWNISCESLLRTEPPGPYSQTPGCAHQRIGPEYTVNFL